MDNNSLMMLGMVKMQHPVTKQVEAVEVKGFDVLGFFFPFLRYLIDGQAKNAVIAFLCCCTVIGYPIVAWYTAFNFKKLRFEHYLKTGWVVVHDADNAAKKAA